VSRPLLTDEVSLSYVIIPSTGHFTGLFIEWYLCRVDAQSRPGGIVSSKIWRVLACPERMLRLGNNRDWQLTENWKWPLNQCVHVCICVCVRVYGVTTYVSAHWLQPSHCNLHMLAQSFYVFLKFYIFSLMCLPDQLYFEDINEVLNAAVHVNDVCTVTL